MNRKRKGNRKTRQEIAKTQQPVFVLEYHQLTFHRLHRQLTLVYPDGIPEPDVRRQFWQSQAVGIYTPDEANSLISQYINALELELQKRISQQSIAYWYHVYRRLSAGGIGKDGRIATIYLTRCVLDAAFQKYGRFDLCNRLRPSIELNIGNVLSGDSQGDERKVIELHLKSANTLMLTNFSVVELAEFYNIEKLAYEVWRTSALARIVGKGALMRVIDEDPFVIDERTQELDELVNEFDSRNLSDSPFETQVSRTGTVYDFEMSGATMFYQLSFGREGASLAGIYLRKKRVRTQTYAPQNYNCIPVNMVGFYHAHQPLSKAFAEKYGFELQDCLTVLTAFSFLPITISERSYPQRILRVESRGYEGMFTMASLKEWIVGLAGAVANKFGNKPSDIVARYEPIIDWLTLKDGDRSHIDLFYAGPHSALLPVNIANNDPQYFVDFCWLYRRLYDLFLGVSVTDNNFKGDALEASTQNRQMPLHSGTLLSEDGTKRQIDASFAVGSRIFIVECRATSRSIGFEKGQPSAIQQHRAKVDQCLRDIDEKARWLSIRPKGRNYDITNFKEIVPVAVMPFDLFIHSKFEWYWLRQNIPRVLTPASLRSVLREIDDNVSLYHGITISE